MIMKISKALGFGLFLHAALIVALSVTSCRTMDTPTPTYQQDEVSATTETGSSGERKLIPAKQLDPAFNGGLSSSSGLEFEEFEGITPKLSPLSPTVDIAGPSFELYTVRKGDSLWGISKRKNVSLEDLLKANNLSKNAVLKIGQQLKLPTDGSTASINTITADTYQPTSFNARTETYVVAKGDTLTKIARKFNISVKLLKTANKKSSDKILVGEKLLIPVDGNSPSGGQSNYSPEPSISSTSNSGIHIVQAGEYPGTIARKYGITTSELLAINGITEPRSIRPGQKLKVNRSSATTSTIIPRSKVPSTPTISPTATATPISQPTVVSPASKPVEIRVIEADPLIETDDSIPDSLFENALEVPVMPEAK